ncbi:hypothetical protein EJB05_13849, partial [Eragrostis curvula]
MLPPQGPTPALMNELVEDILLRFPPDDPAPLFRAALVCKAWCRLISGATFRRQFHKIHRTPPLLGFNCRSGATCRRTGFWSQKTHFTHTPTFRLPSENISTWDPIDALHGRIMFSDTWSTELIAWSSISGEIRRLPMPGRRWFRWSAALFCATAGCDHLICGSGDFTVTFAGRDDTDGFTYAYVYSSEQLVWSEPVFIQERGVRVCGGVFAAQVGTTVYFQCVRDDCSKLLAYELCKQQLSFVSLPSVGRFDVYDSFALIKADEGKLGLLMARHDAKLSMWSREAAPDGDADWTLQRVFELDKIIPSRVLRCHYKLFAAPSSNDVFVIKVDGLLFTIDLKSGGVTELLLDGQREAKDIFQVDQ